MSDELKERSLFRLRRVAAVPRWLLVAIVYFSITDPAWAADKAKARGDGQYVNLITFSIVAVTYLFWLRLTNWVDSDIWRLRQDLEIRRSHALDDNFWNSLVIGIGILGLLIFWVVPWFFLAYPLLLIACFTPLSFYVHTRNLLVPDDKKVMTGRHIASIFERYLHIRFRKEVVEEGPDVQYILEEEFEVEGEEPKINRLKEHKGFVPATDLVWEAVKQRRAALVNLEPTRNAVNVQFTIDGITHTSDGFRRATGDAVIQLFKELAELDVADRRKPQTGKFAAEVEGKRLDFVVSTAGSVTGEKLALRVVDPAQKMPTLSQLGMSDAMQDQLAGLLTRQEGGLVLVCGPDAGTITTTVYACLYKIDRFQNTVMTVEDPPAEKVANVEQVRLNREAGETYSAALPRVLRQDPHVLYVAEAPDAETGELICKGAESRVVVVAVQAADSVAGLLRFIDLGVPAARAAQVLTGVLAVRLVRVLCAQCKVRYRPDPAVVRRANLPAHKIKHFHRPPERNEIERDEQGNLLICENCGGIGYRGRIGVHELLLVTDRIRDLAKDRANANAIKQEAAKGGLVSLQDDAMRLVMEGTTAVAEVLRVFK